MLPLNTILLPTDFSPRADDAFRLACSLAKDHGARLIVLHVRHEPVAVYGEFGHLPVEEENEQTLREQLSRMRPAQSTVRVEYLLATGDAAEEIIRSAEETSASLVVMGTHGRTGLGRLLMGSVAEQVMRKASCPVLTVKMPFHRTCKLTTAPPECAAVARENAPKLGSRNSADEPAELGVGD